MSYNSIQIEDAGSNYNARNCQETMNNEKYMCAPMKLCNSCDIHSAINLELHDCSAAQNVPINTSFWLVICMASYNILSVQSGSVNQSTINLKN